MTDTKKIALLFPGQGSQSVGMGKDLYDAFPRAREVFEELDDILGQNLTKLIFEGPIEGLTQTENTQPALVAVSVAAFRVMEEMGLALTDISYVAGHSLGEYAALCVAGVISFKDAIFLLRERGLAMQEAVPLGEGGMVALIGASLEVAEDIAKKAAVHGVCEVANDNCPGQVVLSGDKVAMDAVVNISESFGVRRAMPLNVSAPFHSSLMKPAADRMEDVLASIPFNKGKVPVLPNVTVRSETDGNILKKLLVAQITGRVRWTETVHFLASQGVTHMYEVGAGKVLSGLVKRTADHIVCMPLNGPNDMELSIKELLI